MSLRVRSMLPTTAIGILVMPNSQPELYRGVRSERELDTNMMSSWINETKSSHECKLQLKSHAYEHTLTDQDLMQLSNIKNFNPSVKNTGESAFSAHT